MGTLKPSGLIDMVFFWGLISPPISANHFSISARLLINPRSTASIACWLIISRAFFAEGGRSWPPRETIRAFSGCASMSGDFQSFNVLK